jgi:hypothetical protein
MSSMAPIRDDHHKAAISLNNTAVSLLARGFLKESIATWKDAVRIMRSATSGSDGTEDGISTLVKNETRHALDRACKRAAYAMDVAPIGSFADVTASTNLQIISSQHSPKRVYEILTSCQDCSSLQVAFLMTIDPVDYESCTSDDLTFEAAAILYNFGVAYSSLATEAVDSMSEDARFFYDVHARAHRIYLMAKCLLSKFDQDLVEANAAPSMVYQLLLLRTILTHNLLNASITMGLHLEYDEYSFSMQFLLQLTEMRHRLLPFEDQAIAAAA